MASSPITDSGLEGDWLWESGEVFYITVNGHLAEAKCLGNLRDGEDQFTLFKRSLLDPAALEEGGIHTGTSFLPPIAMLLLPISIINH